MSDDFDDMGMMRRKVCALEQANGDLGEAIGVLKQERARLWLALDKIANSNKGEGGCYYTNRINIGIARAAIEEIRIDK